MTHLVETATGKYVLKCVAENDAYVRNEPAIADFLKKYSIPIADYIKTKDNYYLWQYDGKIYHLQRFIEGETLAFNKAPDWFMAQSAQLLGKIHSALSEFYPLPTGMGDGFISFMRSDNPKTSYEKTLEKAKSNQDTDIAHDVEYRLSQVDKLKMIEFDLSKFTCCNTHGDYKISQIIIRENRIAAVIDWTSACVHPVCWEVIRSFTHADPSCRDGEINFNRLFNYIREYSRYFSLNGYDLSMMPYFFYHQLLACDYYGQYYASTDANRNDFLFQARFATSLIEWFERNVADLSSRLHALV